MRTEAQIDAIRRRIINVVGHALRTPVTTLNGMADELAERADEPAARAELIAGVRRNARILEQLLDDLLITSGVSTALPVDDPVDIDVAARARELWDALPSDRELKLEGDTTARAPRSVVDQSLSKVLHNAMRYGDGPVELRVFRAGDRAVIEIGSTGGLPSDEELPLSVEAFYRGEHAVMAAPGLGIGLTVARALIEHAGGELSVRVDGPSFVTRIELAAS